MITIDLRVNKQIAKNLSLEGMEVTKQQQKQILDIVNNKKEITNELIRKIALNNEI
ncbi:hypothetical protein L2Z53_00425 [Macrococcoides canis]|uniref:hypothetical protein n=1 Tax=Macrococcoides canis TaxID=1855823 RepID=UPI001F3BE055|nr:hypothetical protein [Macrococcus canis]UJS27857.1 hypothetical protein L2Z53_00425 [Macrococcus canis]